jgi:two-component sensor histidine kinase
MTRAISTTILGIWLVPGLAIFNSLIENFKAERDLLLFQISKQNIRTENQVEVISHSSLLTITDFVNHAKSRLARVSNRDAIKIASEIRSIVDENLRPVSHKIWRREARNFTDYSFRDLLNISTRNYAFSPLIVIPIYTISSFGWMVSHVGILQATIRMLLEGVLTYLILELARRVPVKSNLVAWLRFSFTVIAIGLGNAFFGHLIFSNHFDQHVAPFIIVDIMLVSEVCLLSGILVVALSSHARVKAELNTLLESTTRKAIGFSGTSLLEARELANHLHGEVQNRLLQSALRISAIVTQENRASLTAELDDIERMLSEIESRFQNRIGADVIKELQSIAESWHGIVSVDLIIDDATGANQVLSSMNANEGHDFVQVVSEAVSNSYRHGLASTVSIYIARGSDGIGVRIVDNGIGPVQGKTGLGSKLFDTVTHRNWSLTQRTSGGSELRLQMPTN